MSDWTSFLVLEPDHARKRARMQQPSSVDGRLIATTVSELEFEGPDRAVIVSDITKGLVDVQRPGAPVVDACFQPPLLIAGRRLSAVLASVTLDPTLGVLPVELIDSKGNRWDGYEWIYSTLPYRLPCDVPTSDLFLLETMDWIASRKLMQICERESISGIRFRPLK